MPYINRHNDIYKQDQVETVDQFDTYAEARKMLAEYRLADPSGRYRISQRSTQAWRNAEITAILYEKGYLEMD